MAIGDKKPIVMEYDRAVPGGVATLGLDGKLGDGQIPGLDKLGAAPSGFGYGETSPALSGMEADLNIAFSEIIAGMPNLSTKRIAFTCTDGVFSGMGAFQVELVKHDGEYAYLAGATYNNNYSIRKNFFSGAWSPFEWVDPPAILDVEYRTTARYLGKPVYERVISFGALPAAAVKSVAHGITGLHHVRSVELVAANAASELTNYPWITAVYSDSTNVMVETSADLSSITANAVIRYTKTT